MSKALLMMRAGTKVSERRTMSEQNGSPVYQTVTYNDGTVFHVMKTVQGEVTLAWLRSPSGNTCQVFPYFSNLPKWSL